MWLAWSEREACGAGDARAARTAAGVAQTVEPVMKEIDQRHACEKAEAVGAVHQGRHAGTKALHQTGSWRTKRETEEEAMPHAALAARRAARPTYSISETVMVSRKKE